MAPISQVSLTNIQEMANSLVEHFAAEPEKYRAEGVLSASFPVHKNAAAERVGRQTDDGHVWHTGLRSCAAAICLSSPCCAAGHAYPCNDIKPVAKFL